MSLLGEFGVLGTVELGAPSEHFRRAVLHPPPRRFVVEFIPIDKVVSSYCHGMRICPMYSDSLSSTSTFGDTYEIWRRWDDCLWFFDQLNAKYKTAAKEKRTRLLQGKGVKGYNGLYKRDRASSWESLPPGPDPNSVVQDLSTVLPKVSNKGTIFKPSRSVVEARHKEIQAFVEALFSDSVPALLKEIRQTTVVTDFFGFWRRDYDQAQKSNNRNSVTYSVFSSYFSASNPTLSSGMPSSLGGPMSSAHTSRNYSTERRTRRRDRPSTASGTSRSSRSERRRSDGSDSGRSASTYNPRRTSATSIASSDSGGSNDSNDTLPTPSSPVAESPIIHSHAGPSAPHDRPSSILEVLPEQREMLSKAPERFLSRSPPPNAHPSTPDKRMNRVRQVVGPSPSAPMKPPTVHEETEEEDEEPVREPAREPARNSWQSAVSVSSVNTTSEYLEGLSISLPNKIKEHKFRASLASIATFMTTDSADAIIPKTPTERSFSSGGGVSSRRSAFSLSEFEMYSEDGDELDVPFDLDSFPSPVSVSFSNERPETPTLRSQNDLPTSPDTNHTSFDLPPPSPTSSTVSGAYTIQTISDLSSVTSGSESINLKVVHDDAIIMLRVSRSTSYDDLRQKIYNKFVGQEGVPLGGDFVIAHVLAAPLRIPGSPGPLSSPVSPSSSNHGSMKLLRNENDWERLVMTTSGGKVNLRILDSPSDG